MLENRPSNEFLPPKELLKPRWNSLCQRLNINDTPILFKVLTDHYSEPHRAYHTLNHLQNCFNEFDEVKHLLNNPDAVEMAIWFHDIIYDIGKKDNEEKSAEFAKNFCQKNKLSENFSKEVEHHILATGDHTLSNNSDTNYLIDIDLSILGYPIEEIYKFEEQINKEYSTIYTQKEFLIGRIGFLSIKLKDNDSVFKTEYFKNKYGQSCQDNIPKTIENLQKRYFEIQQNEEY